jgi:hypothetical protein
MLKAILFGLHKTTWSSRRQYNLICLSLSNCGLTVNVLYAILTFNMR